MADTSEPKVDPPTEPTTEAESQPTATETDSTSQPKTGDSESKTEDTAEKPAYTTMATNAASTGIAAATGVKDNVFSMFGGGAKREKKDEPSVSTKVKKEGDEVHTVFC